MELRAREFVGLSEEVRASLLAVATLRNYDNNQFIYLQDDQAESLHLVVSGHVRLSYLMEDGAAVLFAILPQGEIFGELGIFESGRHCDMATAAGSATIASVSARDFNTLSSQHPELGHALGRLVARRYRSYIELTRNLSLKTLSARLAQSLLRLAEEIGNTSIVNGRRATCIGAIVTQTDLGLMARGARGNVNRILKKWERAGLVGLRDRSILLLDRERLELLWMEEEID